MSGATRREISFGPFMLHSAAEVAIQVKVNLEKRRIFFAQKIAEKPKIEKKSFKILLLLLNILFKRSTENETVEQKNKNVKAAPPLLFYQEKAHKKELRHQKGEVNTADLLKGAKVEMAREEKKKSEWLNESLF